MINSRLLLPFFIIFSLLAVEISAQPSVPVSATPMMPLSDVREGMNGIAKTVFRGTQPEAFNVEILGIVPDGIGPRQDLIVGRISGGGADRTAVFAGMSGSPVYIGGKLGKLGRRDTGKIGRVLGAELINADKHFVTTPVVIIHVSGSSVWVMRASGLLGLF